MFSYDFFNFLRLFFSFINSKGTLWLYIRARELNPVLTQTVLGNNGTVIATVRNFPPKTWMTANGPGPPVPSPWVELSDTTRPGCSRPHALR